MTKPPDDEENPVKKAMSKKTTVKLTVVDGGKADGASDKPRRGRKAKPKDEAPPAPEGDDPGPDDSDIVDYPDDDMELPPDGISELDRIIAKECAGWDQNDRDNGKRLVIWFGGGLCYVVGLGWLVWTGTHWLRDEADLEVRLYAQQVVDKIKLEALEIEATPAQRELLDMAAEAKKKPEEKRTSRDKDVILKAVKVRTAISTKRSKRRAWAVTSGNAGKTSAMLEQAKSMKALPIDRLDANAMLFNVKNGTLRFWRELDMDQPEGGSRMIGRFEFLEHDRDHMLTNVADVEYHADAEAPFFKEKFLEKVQPDGAMRTFLQVSTAYSLLCDGNDEQRLFYHYGTGANGKSAFFELIGRLAGTYRQIADPATITGDGQRAGQQANPDVARLHNARLVTIEELPKNTPLREELIKALTGGSKILARFLNKEFFEFLPKFTPMLSGNSKPAISGTDYGIWRRVLLILWGVTIPESERMLPAELTSRLDAERSGILNWLIEGMLLYLGQGLEPFVPAAVKEFTQDYREERDNVSVFAEVAIRPAPGKQVKAGKLYEAYEGWCKVNGLKSASQRSFGDKLVELGHKKKRGAYYVYLDIELLDVPGHAADIGSPPARDPDDPGF